MTVHDASNLATVTDPLDRATAHTYDPAGNVLSTTDALGRVTEMTYDDAGRLVTTVKPSGTTTPDPHDGTIQYQYDPTGRVTTISYSDGTPDLTYTYSPAGRLEAASRADDGIAAADIELAYDDAGRVTGVTRTGPTPASATYGYTSAGRLAAIDYSTGQGATYTYDEAGRLNTTTPTGTTQLEPVTYAYDVASQLNTVTRGTTTPTTTTYTHDPTGQIAELTHATPDATLATYTVTRDARGYPTQMTTAGQPTTTTHEVTDDFDRTVASGWGQTAQGNQWTVDDPDNASVSDGTARHDLTTGTSVTSMLDMPASDSTDVRATFTMDQVLAGDDVELTLVARQVDDLAYRLKLDLWAPDSSMQVNIYAGHQWLGPIYFDHAEDQWGVTYSAGETVAIRLQAEGTAPTTVRAKVWKTQDGEPADWQFTTTDDHPDLQAPGVAAITSGIVEWEEETSESLTVLVDDFSVETAETHDTSTAEYAHDENGWLTSYCAFTTESCPGSDTYVYDELGNRTELATPTGTTTYTYDDANQLLTANDGSDTVLTNTWTPDGTIDTTTTPAGTSTQTTNLANEVTGHELPDGRTVTYSYDPEGNRTARLIDDALSATWTWDNATGLPTRTGQYNANGTPTTTWLPDTLTAGTAITASTPDDDTWLLNDPFGNVAHAAGDTTQLSLASSLLDPFGRATAPNADTTLTGLGFAGQYLDQVTGLYDLRARDYDPATGRFTETDPIAVPVGMPTVNGFTYGFNNPTTYTDRSGLWPSGPDEQAWKTLFAFPISSYRTLDAVGESLTIRGRWEQLNSIHSVYNDSGGGLCGTWDTANVHFNPMYSAVEQASAAYEYHNAGQPGDALIAGHSAALITVATAFGVKGGVSAATGGSPRAPIATSPAAGTAAAPRTWSNLAPDDPLIPGGTVPLNRLSGINGRFDYVVQQDGSLVVGRGGHISLSRGRDVLAAGEVRVFNGTIHMLNNRSGHYRPDGSIAGVARTAFQEQTRLKVQANAWQTVAH
ncbi:RHS repeat-associated core domain-containing protein [Actinotalea sp. C106]|uniref:RHS repeat-associated core domain-containing protein n=1 Tax=Actinotalea sp. C106 TaxID=2908644 RepID=UPI0027E216EF|nr:RHS repeat-associated core domain-containing protein [Actinotalea sp. C106]